MLPDTALARERLPAGTGELVVAAAALAGAFDPAPFDEAPVLEPIERGVERRDVEVDGALGAARDQLTDLVAVPLPFFEVFDLPDQNVSCGTRVVSTVPTQALTLLNNEWILNQARRFADRIATEAPTGHDAQVDRAYLIALSRPPSADEKRVALDFLAKNTLNDFAHVLLNLNEFIYLR